VTIVTKKKKSHTKWKPKTTEIIPIKIKDTEFEKLLLELSELVSDSLNDYKEGDDE